MTNPNQEIFDDQVRRRIYLEAYSDEEVRKVQRFLREVRADLRGKIAELREAFDGSRRQAVKIAAQEQLLASMARLHGDIYQRLEDEIDEGFRLLAASQATFEAGSLSAAVSASVSELTTFQAIGAVRSKPMNGKLLGTWMDALEPDHIERINQAMRISFTEGESMTRAIERLQQVVGVNYRGAEAMVRTSHTHIAGAVQEATYAANDDLVGRYEWRSVLDSRTSPICRARDGKMWPVGRGPMPPAHIRCRSTTTAILDGFEPPERETYGEWLKRQPPQVQDSILGPTKAAAFRRGDYEIGDFVKPTGKPLTLGELKLERVE